MTEHVTPPLLSICIPTYNRPKELLRMLEMLAPQLSEDIEVVVRDDSTNNHSSDVIDRVVAEKGIRCKYYHGEKIGVDAANLFLLEKATGEFIWWFSDDDELLAGGIAKVVDLIKSTPDLNLIWANFDYATIGNAVLNRRSGFFEDGNDALETLGVNIGLLSTHILRRECALTGLDFAKKHVKGFSFAATAVFLYVLSSKSGKSYFLGESYILCNPTSIEEIKSSVIIDGKLDSLYFPVYGVNFYEILKDLECRFDKKSVKIMLSCFFASLWRGMLVGWIGGWDDPKGKRWKMFTLYWSFPEFWIAIILFMMPLAVNKLLYKFYKLFFKHRKFKH